MKAQELARLQRAIDGISSPDSSEPSSPCDFFSELAQSEGPPPHEAPSENPSQDQDKAANGHVLPNTTETTEGTDKRKNETTAADPPHAAEEDEDFNIHLLLKQGRRQRMQRQHQQQSDSKEQPVALPPVEIALEEAAFRVRQRLAQKEEEAAARAARLAGDEVQHVSASGPGGGSRRPAKKQQQGTHTFPILGVCLGAPLGAFAGPSAGGSYFPSSSNIISQQKMRDGGSLGELASAFPCTYTSACFPF